MKDYTIFYLGPPTRSGSQRWTPGVKVWGRVEGEAKLREMFNKNPRPLRLYEHDARGNNLKVLAELRP